MRQLILLLSLCLLWVSPTWAAPWFDSSFETCTVGTNDDFPCEGWLDENNAAHTGRLEVSTQQALSGTKSVKGTFTNPTNSTDNPSIIHTFPVSTHFFARFGYRVTPNFQNGDNYFTKIIRFRGVSLPGRPIFWVSQYQHKYIISVEAPYDKTDTERLPCNVTPSSTSWDQVEFELQLNTPGLSNGFVKLWINNSATPCINSTGRAFIGPDPSSVGPMGYGNPSTLKFEDATIYMQSGVGSVWLDRVAVGPSLDGRIGPVGGTPQPIPDTTAPSPPTNFTVN